MQTFKKIRKYLTILLFGVMALLWFTSFSLAQGFIKDYPHFAALNMGQSQAVEDLGFSALSSPAIGLDKGTQQYAVSYRNLTQGDFGLQNFQAGCKFIVQKTSHFGLQARYTGNSAAHILHFSGQYGRKLSDQFAIGTQLNLGQRNAPQYEVENQLSMDLSLWSKPLKDFELGLWIQHLFPIAGSDFEQASILLSSTYDISPEFNMYGSLYLDVQSNLIVGAGFRYLITPNWDIKISYFPNPGAFTLGLGFYLDHLGGHTGTYIQPEFGIQPGAAFFYNQ